MLNREKFLKRLGISPNWSCESVGFIDQTEFICNDKIIVIFQCYETKNKEKDKRLVLHSPAMLCDNVEAALQFQYYAEEHDKKGNAEKMEVNMLYANMLIKTIERATGRKWQEVQKIARECME